MGIMQEGKGLIGFVEHKVILCVHVHVDIRT